MHQNRNASVLLPGAPRAGRATRSTRRPGTPGRGGQSPRPRRPWLSRARSLQKEHLRVSGTSSVQRDRIYRLYAQLGHVLVCYSEISLSSVCCVLLRRFPGNMDVEVKARTAFRAPSRQPRLGLDCSNKEKARGRISISQNKLRKQSQRGPRSHAARWTQTLGTASASCPNTKTSRGGYRPSPVVGSSISEEEKLAT